MLTTSLPRVPLAHLPTPLEPLPRLSAALGGPQLYVKRDDQTGLAAGGNKSRKLEFLFGQALAQDAGCVLTAGAPQSNHCAQTAAAAARHGLRCVLVLRGDPPEQFTGNLLLDQLFEAELVWTGEQTREAVLAERTAAEAAAGRRPYAIPIGGSTPVGAVGYALALGEILDQAAERGLRFDRLIVASSSGGTQAGLVAGAQLTGYDGQILGISIDAPAPALQEKVAALANDVLALLAPSTQPSARVTPADIAVIAGYLGAGYGIMGLAERAAIRLFAETEGLLVDPVYTGRAAAGLIDLARRGAFQRQENILFWHTGGTAALYAYADQVLA